MKISGRASLAHRVFGAGPSWGCGFLLGAMLTAQSLAGWPEELAEGAQALKESIPQVAVLKYRAFLASSEGSAPERAEATRQLTRALLAIRQFGEALETIAPLATPADPAARMLQADGLVAAQRWAEALPIYRELEKSGQAAARLGMAECLQALGKMNSAIELLEKGAQGVLPRLRLVSCYLEVQQLKKAGTLLKAVEARVPLEIKWKKFLEGRLYLLEDQPEPARVCFKEVLADPVGLTEEMLIGATLGVTEARIRMDGYETADREVETFIWQNPNSSYLSEMFYRLDEIYAREDDPPNGELQKWMKVAPPARAALAHYYLARMQMRDRKYDKAANTLAGFVGAYPGHSMLPQVHQAQADLLVRKKDFAGAVRALEAAERQAKDDLTRGEIEMRSGLVHYAAGEYLLAGNQFELAGKRAPNLRERALYNGALAALNQRNFERFGELYRELSAKFRDSALRSELVVEQGLLQARNGDPRAAESLQSFLRQFPRHAREGEARLALAELAMGAGEMDSAQTYRQTLNPAANSGELNDQSEYLAIFLLDGQTPRHDEALIELATKFIRERPQSALLPEVRMKLGQVYFRNDDFANAATQFVTLAEKNPESPYAETALFLAGQSAMRSINSESVDRALGLFEGVIKRDGPLKLYAREQQAIMQRQLGKESEAVKLYDVILGAQPAPDPELMYAAMVGKADTLVAQKEPKQIEAAVPIFAQLAALPAVPAVWRNQALFKEAKALELLGRIPEALATYYDVLAGPGTEGREFVWYYKAGFEAARLFELQLEWRSAIGIYEKMSKLAGPRAEEARTQLKQLRLEHFIWE